MATQRITGVDERQRIVAAVIEEPMYFADSTNSVRASNEEVYSLHYLAALLNSDLFQWRFRLTSTNNNVGTNELESLPFRTIDPDSEVDQKLYDAVCSLARRISRTQLELAIARSVSDLEGLQRRLHQGYSRLNELVFRLYGLSEQDVALVRSRLTSYDHRFEVD
ncbi:TaqI-like C-terminal specificity domain-containing protein [Micromonospora sp. WMMA2032]|uniref:TaqI-like C-terminal specificity domain-containing protein n=1 Tax=Micromonospora sp. WMMA2032 TaxID=2039870 RepID=UPI00352CAF60